MTSAGPPLAPATPRPSPRRYCRTCKHDVSGISIVRCPECGEEFNPDDPSTTLDSPVPSWRRSFIVRHGVRIAAVLLVMVGFRSSALPRPEYWNDWDLWIWFGRPIGVLHRRTPGLSTQAVGHPALPINLPAFRLPDHDVYAYLWFGDETRREAYRADDQSLSWRIEDLGGHRYRMQTFEPGIRSDALLAAFNSVKGTHRFFGVRVDRPRKRVSDAPFLIEGDEAVIFSALVREYGFPIMPFRIAWNQKHVWAWDHIKESMAPIDLTPANTEDYPLDDRDPSRVLIPKP